MLELSTVISMHNRHFGSLDEFLNHDPQLYGLKKLPFVFQYSVEKQLPTNVPGIYTLNGGRQLGKSTVLKKLMSRLMAEGVPPSNIFYIPCDSLTDRTELSALIDRFVAQTDQSHLSYLFLDEVTFLAEWQLVVKSFADAGLFRRQVCVISGSDRIMIDQAVEALPGRRGSASVMDFLLWPLSFAEYVKLTKSDSVPALESFGRYLNTGGYLRAINAFAESGSISSDIYAVYQQWVLGDFSRLNRSRHILLQVLRAILVGYGSQLSFNSLANKTDGVSADTVQEYCELLERLGVVALQRAFDQNSLNAAPKKNKKFHFTDPFIFTALKKLVEREFHLQLDIEESHIVESCVFVNISRFRPTFYIKGQGEVDVVWTVGRRFYPAEVKWRMQIRTQDLKELLKYKNGIVFSKYQYENPRTQNYLLAEFMKDFPNSLEEIETRN